MALSAVLRRIKSTEFDWRECWQGWKQVELSSTAGWSIIGSTALENNLTLPHKVNVYIFSSDKPTSSYLP